MTEKARVMIRSHWGGIPREYNLAPGETMEIVADFAQTAIIPAKGPQPEATRGGWSYRYDRGGERYRYRPDPCMGWMDLPFGAVGGISPDFLRFLADLKERTLKWHAS